MSHAGEKGFTARFSRNEVCELKAFYRNCTIQLYSNIAGLPVDLKNNPGYAFNYIR